MKGFLICVQLSVLIGGVQTLGRYRANVSGEFREARLKAATRENRSIDFEDAHLSVECIAENWPLSVHRCQRMRDLVSARHEVQLKPVNTHF